MSKAAERSRRHRRDIFVSQLAYISEMVVDVAYERAVFGGMVITVGRLVRIENIVTAR